MLAQCPEVTTMGDRTAGSRGNPRRIDLECGIAVNLLRWLDMDPEGHPIEHVGIPPDVPVEVAPGKLDEAHDPVTEAALARLRAIPAGKRTPGKPR
jgi:C-terminal processing protease CtpA/Prc